MISKIRVFLFVLFVACAASHAAQAATTGEKQIGQTGCKNGASSVDFDTIAQCSSNDATAGTFQKAPVFLGSVTAPPYPSTNCDSNKAGLVQYTASGGFQGCNGTAWTGLDESSAFPALIAQNGWTKLPNGLIFQWGYAPPSGASLTTFSFPIPFPNAVFSITLALKAASTDGGAVERYLYSNTLTSATIQTYNSFGGVNWMAIGN